MTRPRNLRAEFFNLPNVLTLARIGLIPVVLWLMYLDTGGKAGALSETKGVAALAALIYAAAAVTDWLDGWLARNLDMGSILGKFMDPVADKILVMAVGVMLVQMDRLPAWLVILLLTREISITALRMVAESEGLHLDVDQTGKWKTAFQMIGLLGLIIHYEYATDYLVWQTKIDYHRVGVACVGISLFFSVFSAVGYFWKFVRAIKEKYPEVSS
jgi:CDP-diacylglycerol--glycerol-3-phosphate 3-phosphatidyltransferase